MERIVDLFIWSLRVASVPYAGVYVHWLVQYFRGRDYVDPPGCAALVILILLIASWFV